MISVDHIAHLGFLDHKVHFAGRLARLNLWVLFIIGLEAQKDWLMLGPILFPKLVFKTKSISSIVIENLSQSIGDTLSKIHVPFSIQVSIE